MLDIMIKQEELIKIGQFRKPHGIKGEIAFDFSNDAFDESDCPFLICEMDGIFVPFRLEEYRFKSNSSALVKLKNIDSEAKVKPLANKEVYFPKEHIDSTETEDYTWDYFIGFSLIDKQSVPIGAIVAVDDSTLNTLFVVERDNDEILIPVHEEIIIRIDEGKKEIQVELPEGILDLE
jgi:16S rRNA processing protein RimM